MRYASLQLLALPFLLVVPVCGAYPSRMEARHNEIASKS